MNFFIAKVHGAEKIRVRDKQTVSLPLKRGLIYVTRTVVSGGKFHEIPVQLDRQDQYARWRGCWSAL